MEEKFLIRKHGKKVSAHIWNGEDTVCRMWSSGGLRQDRYDVRTNRNEHRLCRVCVDLSKRKPDRLFPKKSQSNQRDKEIAFVNTLTTPVRRGGHSPSTLPPEEWLDAYRKVRYSVIKRDGAICRACGSQGGLDNPIQVDHIKPRSKFPELSLDPNNMQVLCKTCNYGKGAWDQTDWRLKESKPDSELHMEFNIKVIVTYHSSEPSEVRGIKILESYQDIIDKKLNEYGVSLVKKISADIL